MTSPLTPILIRRALLLSLSLLTLLAIALYGWTRFPYQPLSVEEAISEAFPDDEVAVVHYYRKPRDERERTVARLLVGSSQAQYVMTHQTRVDADIKREIAIKDALSPVGLSSPMIHHRPNFYVSPYVEASEPHPPYTAVFLENLGKALKQLHSIDANFQLTRYKEDRVYFDSRTQDAREALSEYDGVEPLLALMDETNAIRQTMQTSHFCHNDLWWENIFRLPDERVQFLDFETSGLGDPMFDLAYLILTLQFTPEQEKQVIAAYGEEWTAEQRYHYLACKQLVLVRLMMARHLPLPFESAQYEAAESVAWQALDFERLAIKPEEYGYVMVRTAVEEVARLEVEKQALMPVSLPATR